MEMMADSKPIPFLAEGDVVPMPSPTIRPDVYPNAL